jgi:hypothetical protein
MTITDPSVDDLAGICLPLASREVRRILDCVGPEDLNACEMVALLAVLRPAYQRVQAVEAQPVSLKLVRFRTRRRLSLKSALLHRLHGQSPVDNTLTATFQASPNVPPTFAEARIITP